MLFPVSSVLTPVRRRRRRYRRRRLLPIVLGILLAACAGAWLGSHRGTGASPETAAAAARPTVKPKPKPKPHAAKPAPAHERLLTGGSQVSHRFAPRLLAASAILVDADTGRVLWKLRAHQRRDVASTTKIMTALLALRKLGPHTIVTVDKSVPRVPLVKEGLRAGERVQAWKLFYAMLLFSGNDDALALAIAAGGDKSSFVHEMNREARRLGLGSALALGVAALSVAMPDMLYASWMLADPFAYPLVLGALAAAAVPVALSWASAIATTATP